VLEDDIPENLQFLEHGYTIPVEEADMSADVSVAIDCGEDSRYPKRAKKFHDAPVSICIDHHATSEPIFDYNIIDPAAAASAELVYQVIRQLDQPIDRETAEALYTGINTDTGKFQYSNTTALTHRIAADLIDCGVDVNQINVELYESLRPEKLMVESRIMNSVEFYEDGKLAIASISKKALDQSGVKTGETDNVIALMRSIRGVEIAAFLKEKAENEVKVSFRAKGDCDVASIAGGFGGGGHKKASGATLHMTLDDAVRTVREKCIESIAEHE
jgi:phosphoesterase RecJ-like protein